MTLAGVVVSRESVSPLEVAMADLAMELSREKLRARGGSTEAATRGWVAGDGVGASDAIGGAETSTRSSGSGGTAGGSGRVLVPRPYVPAADHDVCAPERAEARAVVVKLDADGALPAAVVIPRARDRCSSEADRPTTPRTTPKPVPATPTPTNISSI